MSHDGKLKALKIIRNLYTHLKVLDCLSNANGASKPQLESHNFKRLGDNCT